MPTERLWVLTNEAVANGLFEEIEEIEEALVERCLELLEQTETPSRASPATTGGLRQHDALRTLKTDSVCLGWSTEGMKLEYGSKTVAGSRIRDVLESPWETHEPAKTSGP